MHREGIGSWCYFLVALRFLRIFSPKATHCLLQLILIPSQVTPTSSIHFHVILLLASISWSMFFVNKYPGLLLPFMLLPLHLIVCLIVSFLIHKSLG